MNQLFGPLNRLKEFFHRLTETKAGVTGLVAVSGFIAIALLAPFLRTEDPMRTPLNASERILLPPSSEYWLGTDDVGRDIWSQVIYGSRVSLLVGGLGTLIAVLLGALIGLVSGFHGGRIDEILMRIVDIALVIPMLPLVIVLAAALGRSVWNTILVIGMVGWPSIVRIVRSQVASIRERPFVEAARCVGEGDVGLILREILPNVMPIILAQAVLWMTEAIYAQAFLSFLGLGDPTLCSWGTVLHFAFASGAMTLAPWWVVSPVAAIALLIIGFAFLGSAVNDILNPRA